MGPLLFVLLPSVWSAPVTLPNPAYSQGSSAQEQPAQAPVAAEPSAAPLPDTVRVVYTGGSGGVGSVKYSFEVLRDLDRLGESAKLEKIQAFHGALAQDEWLLWGEDRSVIALLRALNLEAITCEAPRETATVVTSQDVLVLDGEDAPLWLAKMPGERRPATWRRCLAGDASLTLVGPQDAPLPDWSLKRWEFRRALEGVVREGERTDPITIVGRPLQELARNVTAIEGLLAEHPGALYVDAGDLLDGASSVHEGALSLHRPTSLAVATRLRPAALVPGNNELLAGAQAFFDETRASGLHWVATNWSSTNPALDLPRSAVRAVQTSGGTVQIAFLGVVDPALQDYIPALATEGVTLADPIATLNAEVDRLRATETPPDVVILLTTASDEVRAQIRRQVRGIDVMIGDPSFATLRVLEDRATLRPLPPGAKGAALTVPMDGIGTLELGFTKGVLSEVRTTPRLVRADAPGDPEVRERVTRVRAEVYPTLDVPLLDNPNPTRTLDAATWEALICEAVRRETEADTVLLRALPPPPRQPGPLTEMMVRDQLALLDVIEVHEIPGDRMPDLLDKVYSVAPVSCGARPGELFPRARGRLLEDGRTYRVVTTDRTRAGSLLDGILKAVESLRPLDQPTWHVLRREDGTPVTLQRAALDGLRALRDARGGTSGLTTHITTVAPREILPLWLVRLRTLSLTASRYEGVNDEAFASVPETQATAPDSVYLDTGLDLALEHTSGATEWDLRARTDFAMLRYAGADGEETSDDAIFSTSLGLPRLAWPTQGPLRLMPYGELRLDSELTPTEGNARQADLSLLAGLSAVKTMNVRGLHLGVFVNEDLSTSGRPELGLRGDVQTFHLVGDAMKIMTSADLQLFARGPDDDASDLRLLGEAELKLAFPLAHWLDLAPYAQGFALAGRVPETEHLGLSWTLGVALDASAAFEL